MEPHSPGHADPRIQPAHSSPARRHRLHENCDDPVLLGNRVRRSSDPTGPGRLSMLLSTWETAKWLLCSRRLRASALTTGRFDARPQFGLVTVSKPLERTTTRSCRRRMARRINPCDAGGKKPAISRGTPDGHQWNRSREKGCGWSAGCRPGWPPPLGRRPVRGRSTPQAGIPPLTACARIHGAGQPREEKGGRQEPGACGHDYARDAKTNSSPEQAETGHDKFHALTLVRMSALFNFLSAGARPPRQAWHRTSQAVDDRALLPCTSATSAWPVA